MRTVKYDAQLGLEAYHFEGILQKFPNHFHDYYVVGFIERGNRLLSCGQREYLIAPGDLVLFHPGESHACRQCDGKALDYRSLNISRETMERAVLEITGSAGLPMFAQPVAYHSELVAPLRELHRMIMGQEGELRKEERFFFLLEQLMEENARPAAQLPAPEPRAEIEAVCGYLEENYMHAVTLEELSRLAGLSKYYLLRSFTRQKGISPYSYLATVRVDRAKRLLEKGAAPVEAALQTGFSDQSHFSNFFKRFIGLTPRQYRSIFRHSFEADKHS
ncbi:HTH-type transcriptional activator RhaS [bioreactor metagenome]|uniref:HTH-type transcriptional activator RhaS n=1 Tax=bioreactor metagenome TaxID=1076179 RepID=A0A645CRF9_9ZZZZ